MGFHGLRVAFFAILALTLNAAPCSESDGTCAAGGEEIPEHSTLLQGRVKFDIAQDDAEEAQVETAVKEAESDNADVNDEDGEFIADEAEERDIDENADEVELSSEDAMKMATDGQVQDACSDPCDTACLENANKASFVECDADKNNKLTIDEIQSCHIDGTDETIAAGVALYQQVSESRAREFMEFYDEDKDNELTPDEYLKAIVPCEASLKEEGTVLSKTTGIANCVAETVKRVTSKENYKCEKREQHQSCSLVQTNLQNDKNDESLAQTDQQEETDDQEEIGMADQLQGRRRRRRGWGVKKVVRHVVRAVVCSWHTVVKIVNCVRDVVRNVVNSVRASFTDCWNNIVKGVSGGFMELIKNCNSVDKCLDHLLAGPKALLDKIVDLAKAGLNALKKGPVGKAVDYVMRVAKKVPPIAHAVGGAFVDAVNAVGKLVQGAAQAIRDQKSLNFCTTAGMGYWSYKATDCGAFGRMKDIFKVSNIGSIPGIFRDVLAKFGKCVIKLGALSLPSPFMDVKVSSFCVPKWLQLPIMGIVGTFRFLMQQIAAAASGCKDPTQPICVMVEDFKKVGAKIKTAFAASLLETSTAIVSDATGERYDSKCSGTDFSIFVTLKVALSFPPPIESGVTFGFTFTQGCRDNRYFADLLFGIHGLLFLMGYDLGPIEKSKGAIAVDLGFNVAKPSADVVQWKGQFAIIGAAKWGNTAIKIVLGFKMLPDPTYPTGFSLSFTAKASCIFGCLLEETAEDLAAERKLQDALVQEESVEGKIRAGMGHVFSEMAKADFAQLGQHELLIAGLKRGAAIMAGKGSEDESSLPVPDSASLHAGLGSDFCLTCGANDKEKKAAGATPAGAPSASTAASPPRRRAPPRRRRDRRRARPAGIGVGWTIALRGGRGRRWCADEGNQIKCNRNHIKGWERFYVGDGGNGRIGLRGGRHRRWCADEGNNVKCNRGHVKGWERFTPMATGGRVGLKGGRTGRWCADEINRWICNRGHVHGWEKFEVRNVR